MLEIVLSNLANKEVRKITKLSKGYEVEVVAHTKMQFSHKEVLEQAKIMRDLFNYKEIDKLMEYLNYELRTN